MEDYLKKCKAIAKTENEQPVERWVSIEFGIRNMKDRSFLRLHSIDIPCSMLERWRWIIYWREAKLICQYPFENVQTYYGYYCKNKNEETGMQTLLYRFSAAKGQITKVERKIEEYTKERSENDMFFDTDTDERLLKLRTKLNQKCKNLEERQGELKAMVQTSS